MWGPHTISNITFRTNFNKALALSEALTFLISGKLCIKQYRSDNRMQTKSASTVHEQFCLAAGGGGTNGSFLRLSELWGFGGGHLIQRRERGLLKPSARGPPFSEESIEVLML